MRPSTRLFLSGVLIVLSAAYGVIVAEDPDVAAAIAAGYIAILLSVMFAVNHWKKPHDG